MPPWRVERGKSPSIATQQKKQQSLELLSEFKSVMSGECIASELWEDY